jgi:membrane protein YdbS with pleckstrin-like domain
MGYAEKNLAPGESILYRARYHWVLYRFTIIVLVLAAALGVGALYARRAQAGDEVGRPLAYIAVVFVVLALLAFLVRRFRASQDEFVVTNRRVIRKVGFYAREIQQAPLEKVQDITVEQGVFGRMLGYGTVIVETASEKGMLVFPKIASPEGFRNAVWGQAPPVPSVSGAGTVPAAAGGVATKARLEELEKLKQQGLINDEEYAAKRKEILSHL